MTHLTADQLDPALKAAFEKADKDRSRFAVDGEGNTWNRIPYGSGWMMTERKKEELPKYSNDWTFGR